MKKVIYCFAVMFLVLIDLQLYGQNVPTVQDCMGAIPICENVYVEPDPYSYSGNGNYLSEIQQYQQCITPEDNGVWYSFSAQTSGFLRFTISPNNNDDDYDWIVFDITQGNCASLSANTQNYTISSNNWGSTTTNGPTGANSYNSGGAAGHCNGPGEENGPTWNDDIPVLYSHSYLLYLSNWSGSDRGYTIDFSASDAVIFDINPPFLSYTDNLTCGDTQMYFTFNENVVCETVETADFELTSDNSTTYTITNIESLECSSGANFGRNFLITFQPPVQSNELMTLRLNPNSSGSVLDLCGNLAEEDIIQLPSTNIAFIVSKTDITCSGAGDGTILISASGTSNTFSIDGGLNFQTGGFFSNLQAGEYEIIVRNENGCEAPPYIVTIVEPDGMNFLNITTENILCNGDLTGSIFVEITGGTPPIEYHLSTGITQNSNYFSNLAAGTYSIFVTDANACPLQIPAVTLTEPEPLQINLETVEEPLCYNDANGNITIAVSGGTIQNNYQILWDNNATTYSLSNLPAGSYTVTVTDDNACEVTRTIELHQPNELLVSLQPQNIDCQLPDFGLIVFELVGGTYPFQIVWSSLNGSSTSDLFHLQPDFYTVYVTDANNCTTTGFTEITFYDCDSELEVPNVFTPNNDGINDYFVVVWKDIKDYEAKIYNRWGEIVYSSTNPAEKWDGINSFTNQIVSEGVYFYIIKALGEDGVFYDLRGSLHIYYR